jgi:TPR repeat protein
LLLLALWLFVPMARSAGTDHPKSLALKALAPDQSPFRLQRDHSAEDLWDAFMLVKEANAGNSVAQQDLGLRYLMGKGFFADTEKAAYWIGKAALQNLVSARYNFGLLLNNGWGIAWNPFEAYRNFQYAATHGLVEAEYVYGLLQTDNLVLPRNYVEAYHWIKMAADSGFAPALDVLKEFEKRGIMARITALTKESHAGGPPNQSKAAARPKSALRPVLLDFVSDSIPPPDNQTLLKEAALEGSDTVKTALDSAGSHAPDSTTGTAALEAFSDAAESGSPEALTMVGRLYEQGLGVKKDLIQAAVYYLRAVRFDSPWSPLLLWNMVQNKEYFRTLKERVDGGDPAAELVWAGLIEFGYDNQLTEAQSLALLEDAARRGYREAIVQLGVCYYAGHWVHKDREKALALLHRAEQLGSREAQIRVCMIELNDADPAVNAPRLLQTLQQAASKGSVLAEAVLGYCYQEGKGVRANTSEAVRLYRRAAQRGSQIAYDALRKMYDGIRPNAPEFQLEE